MLEVNLVFEKTRRKKLTNNSCCLGKTLKQLVLFARLVLYLHVYGSPMSLMHSEIHFINETSNSTPAPTSLSLSSPSNNSILAEIFQSLPGKSIGETQISFPSYLVLLAWDPHYAISFEFAAFCHFKRHVPPSLSVLSPLRFPLCLIPFYLSDVKERDVLLPLFQVRRKALPPHVNAGILARHIKTMNDSFTFLSRGSQWYKGQLFRARAPVHAAVHCETPVCHFSHPGGKSDKIARKNGSSDRPKLGEHCFPPGKKEINSSPHTETWH